MCTGIKSHDAYHTDNDSWHVHEYYVHNIHHEDLYHNYGLFNDINQLISTIMSQRYIYYHDMSTDIKSHDIHQDS